MKVKISLFFIPILGFLVMVQANADCPATLSYGEYIKLKNGQEVKGYVFRYENFGSRIVSQWNTLYYNPKPDKRFCGYNLWPEPFISSQLFISPQGGLTIKKKK